SRRPLIRLDGGAGLEAPGSFRQGLGRGRRERANTAGAHRALSPCEKVHRAIELEKATWQRAAHSTMAPPRSRPTPWNEYFLISMAITATAALRVLAIARSFSSVPRPA